MRFSESNVKHSYQKKKFNLQLCLYKKLNLYLTPLKDIDHNVPEKEKNRREKGRKEKRMETIGMTTL